MIPSVLARQLDRGIRDFIGATFPMASPYFKGMVDDFLDKPGNVFKGPYYQLGLPFQHGETGTIPFGTIRIEGFHPWAHQDSAWRRLGGDEPQSTIVATGTGSGKTECFLYPILDYCARHRGRGIKAILLYPMNALADDQARRIAGLIATQPGLAGLRAGVYTGSASEIRQKNMGPQQLITDRDTLREYPPDILLTNYKMLDLLLLRAKDRSLWDSRTLRYLVVDELHSFDGAQGTDLACLIRRLRERLGRSDPDSVACVGTSATLGSGDAARIALLDFARRVFHADIDGQALVEETREGEQAFLAEAWVSRVGLPGPGHAELLRPFSGGPDSSQDGDYIGRQQRLWFPDVQWAGTDEDRITLGAELKGHGVFQNILRYMEGRARSADDLAAHIRKTWAPARVWSDDHIALCIDSLFALISHARRRDGVRIVPFLTVRTQFWMRELRRLVAGITVEEPGGKTIVPLRLSDELPPGDRKTWLPVVHCRECNAAGWLTRESPGEAPVMKDLRAIYNGYFGGSKDTIILYPIEPDSRSPEDATSWMLCPECGFISHEHDQVCAHCHHSRLLPVWKSRLVNSKGKFDSSCPRCGSAGDLAVMGSKAASLLAALVGQTFASPFNNDKKLLAFSDSVQDAAHRAGFLTARAWTFSFRTAICEALAQCDGPCSLSDLARLFIEGWKGKFGNPEDFVGTFLPPDLEWFEDYDFLVRDGRLPAGSDIVDRLERRLSWELASEFTFRSRIGRTLERTGTAMAVPDRGLLARCAAELAAEAAQRQERFRAVAPDLPGWEQLLWGMVFRFKNLGALNEPGIRPLFEYGSTFPYQRTYRHMPAFSKRAPHVVTDVPLKSVHEALFATDKRRSWFESWLQACRDALLPEYQFDSPPEDAELLRLAVAALQRNGILARIDLPGDHSGWLLEPSALMVSSTIARLSCSACGSSLEAAVDDLPVTRNLPCLRIGCRGRYRDDPGTARDYYRNFYRQGQVVRINGREHTGLLGGIERKRLEDSFLSGAHPWDPNLLSATPTLEMGINIGDLSTVFLCSIPPGVANYLQRIGRAGRVDGNANVVSMANAVPHDQYFFQSPLEMMEGAVDAPAIYDRAVAVLERHLTAFALARWTRAMPPQVDPVPRTLGDLVAARKNQNKELFPLAFFEALDRGREQWLADFFLVFDHLDAEGDERAYLQTWLSADPAQEHTLVRVIAARLDGVSASLESMRSRRDSLRKRARDQRAQGALTEELARECQELEREADGLRSGIEEIKKTETWQFLCDEGILPNYAFPESGVKLKATFYRKNQTGGDSQFRYDHVELVRSASSALREFAPENEFFGNGHRMKINRVDLKASTLETWRFCPACSHAVPETHEHFHLGDCPVCRSQGWADAGQVHSLLRFRQVYSFSSYRESLISDNQEDREPVFYNTKLLVDFDPADPDNRYFGLEDRHAPIAIEFIRRATFREINFGRMDGGPQGFPVAGELDSKSGFPVCTACGSLDMDNHAPDCPNRKRSDADGATRQVIHLYHEFRSEAIRLLVPANEFPLDADIAIESTVASLYLGLRKHFGGKADHLRITQERSETSGGASLRYLVIYDSIPGGSGYLKDFFTEAAKDGTMSFFTILEKALAALRDCSCRLDPDKDGCYRCVLSHKVSRRMKDVSRTMAIKVLERILAEQDRIIRLQEQAAARVDPLYDSRLEELFVGVLQTPDLWPVAVSLTPEMYRSKTGQYVQIGNRGYHLEQQALIAVHDPLPAVCCADFVFRPVAEGEKPLVVFTDGYRYHKDIVADDLRIRLALCLSGLYRVFAFTWEDVASVAEHRPSELEREGHPWIQHSVDPRITRVLHRLQLDRQAWPGCDHDTGLVALVAMLALPESDRERLWLDKARFSALSAALSAVPSAEPIASLAQQTGLAFGPGARMSTKELSAGTDHRLTLVLDASSAAVVPDLAAWILFNDAGEFERSDWNALLELVNFYQILPRFVFAAASRAGEPDWMAPAFAARAQPAVARDDAWSTVLDCVLASWRPLVGHLRDSGLPVPEVGYEPVDAAGIVLFTAELAWPDKHLALLAAPPRPEGQVPGWTLIHWSPGQPYPVLELEGTP
jgi:DEAD/DEAH box helicase domain-containing protein